MAEKEEKVPAVVFVLGLVAGAISTYAVTSLIQPPSLAAAVVGGIIGAGSVDPRESVLKEIGWAHAIGGLLFGILMYWMISPEDNPGDRAVAWFFGILFLGGPIGGFAGGLVFQLWKALARPRLPDHLKPQETPSAKSVAESKEKIPEGVYFLGIVAGALFTFGVAYEWMLPVPGLYAVPELYVAEAMLGGLGGLLGVDLRKSIWWALLWALPAAGLTLLTIVLPPEYDFITVLSVPLFVGCFAGVLVFNLWKALVR